MKKKLFSILLSLCMVMTLIPSVAGVAQAESDDDGWQGALLFSTSYQETSITTLSNGMSNCIEFDSESVKDGVASGTYYLYLAQVRENNKVWEIKSGSMQQLTADGNNFDIQYIVGDNGKSIKASEGALTFAKDTTSEAKDNQYVVQLDTSKQLRYSEGYKRFDVWPNSHEYTYKDGDKDVTVTVYNSSVCLASDRGVEKKGLVFSSLDGLENVGKINEDTDLGLIDKTLNPNGGGSFELYPYIATYKDCGESREYTALRELGSNESIKVEYISGYSNGDPTYATSTSVRFEKIDGNDTGKYQFECRPDEYASIQNDSFYGKAYRLSVTSSTQGETIEPLFIAFKETGDDDQGGGDGNYDNEKPEYYITADLRVDPAEYTYADGTTTMETGEGLQNRLATEGQGDVIVFTDAMARPVSEDVNAEKVAHWYVGFYVCSKANGGRDVNNDYESGDDEERFYIGRENDFVIQAKDGHDGSEWFDLTGSEVPKKGDSNYDAYNNLKDIFSISYNSTFKDEENIYEIKYYPNNNKTKDENGGDDYHTSHYQFRLKFVGTDSNLAKVGGDDGKYIRLCRDDNSTATNFSFDQYFVGGQDENGNDLWCTGNTQYFDKVGDTLIAKMIIRPAGSFDHEKRIFYTKEFFAYITGEDEIDNFEIWSQDPNTGEDWRQISKDDAPFTISWVDNGNDAKDGYYTITYNRPYRDKYGPYYTIKYVGSDWKTKVTTQLSSDAIEKLQITDDSRSPGESSFWTRKYTEYVDNFDYVDGQYYTFTEYNGNEITIQEVVLNEGVMNSVDATDEVEIETSEAWVDFSGSLVTSMKNENTEDSVSFTVQDVTRETYDLEDEQIEVLEENASTTIAALDLSITSGESNVEFGKTGEAEVTIQLDNEEDINKDLTVYYLDDSGNMTEVPAEKTIFDGDSGEEGAGLITFTTSHFSTYIVSTNPNLETKSNPTPSGGGSAGGSASTTDNVTNTAENKATETAATTTATVKAETKTDSTGAKTTSATVDSTTASKIVTKAVENKSEEVVVDTSSQASVTETAAGAKTEVSIPAETISQISEKTEADVVIKTDAAEVVLDEKTVETVAEQAGTTGDVKLVVETVAQDDSKVQVELKLVSSNGNISDFNGGNVNVTVKLGKTLAAKKLICVYIDDHGTYHKVSGQLNADGTYTFTTTHFSSYAIMAEDDVDKIIAEQIANVEKMVGKLSLKARSSKTSKGNIKVKLITDASDIKDLEDLGYTVKYKFYRSTKKASSYKAKFETSGKTYTNTTGKKGTRYYYKARVMVYDAQGTLIAKSALKQCKFATRTK